MMWKWLQGIFKKKQKIVSEEVINPIGCSTCIWWASEEENNAQSAEEFSKQFAEYPGEYKFCDIHKEYTHKIHSCHLYGEELFEATPNSTQTEEKIINHELLIDGSNENGIIGEKK